jgi:hypothetical protein
MESVLDSMVNKASILHDYIQKHHSALLATVNKPPQDVQTWFDGLVAEAATGKKTPTLWSVWRTGGDLKALEKSDLTESETVEHEVVSSVESELTDDREEHSDIESEHSYHSEDTEDQFSDQHSYAESDYRFDEEEYSDFGSYSDEEEPAEIQKVFERDVDTLLASLADAWGFSDSERGRLVDYLEDESKRTVDKEATATFREAVKKYNRARRELEQARNNVSKGDSLF